MKEFCFYKTPNNRRIVGVSNAVNIPFSVNPRLAYAPYLLLMSMAVEVPTAWAAVPIESPWAIGLPTCMIFIVLNPQMAPSKPTATTTDLENKISRNCNVDIAKLSTFAAQITNRNKVYNIIQIYLCLI